VLPEDLPFYSIRAGSSNSRIGGQTINIAAVYRHPNYEAYPPKHDIAVIKLEAPVVVGDVKPAILPKRGFEIKHVAVSCKVFVWVIFSGWGSLNYKEQPCDALQTSFVPLIDGRICENLYDKLFNDTIHLCAAEEARTNCQGDSGSGLLLDNMLVGIATISAGCPNDKTPTNYLKITAYLDFIEQYMEKSQSMNQFKS
jgi:secreted trypsin-like serine protease